MVVMVTSDGEGDERPGSASTTSLPLPAPLTTSGNNNSNSSTSTCVRVAVRVRPLIGQELVERSTECVRCVTAEIPQVAVGTASSFSFDYVFGQQAAQDDIYNDCVSPLVAAAFEGFNATVLAYGQTGSGKTYTMGSASNMHVPPEEQGIIPRVIQDMFCTIRQGQDPGTSPSTEYMVKVQFLEIYGEEIKDLLDPLNTGVAIRENQNGEINVVGAKEEVVESEEAMMLILERGSVYRTTGSTLMNAQSSRSHAIFTILLENRILRPESNGQGDEQWETRRSKFHFVDLAGSERAKRTGAQGKRLREGIDINKGLLVLGNVISALGDVKKRGSHVPYRDSRLTRMLQDSLGGNSRTVMICCVSPAISNMAETINALRYANRARNIQNTPVVNRDRDSTIIVELKKQVQALAMELLRLKSGGATGEQPPELPGNEAPVTSRELLERLVAHSGTMVALHEPYDVLKQRLAEADMEIHRLTDENKKLKARSSQLSEELLQNTADREYFRLAVATAMEGVPPESHLDEGEGGAVVAINRTTFTNALKPYLSEIAALRETTTALERAKCDLQVRLSRTEAVNGGPGSLRGPRHLLSFIHSRGNSFQEDGCTVAMHSRMSSFQDTCTRTCIGDFQDDLTWLNGATTINAAIGPSDLEALEEEGDRLYPTDMEESGLTQAVPVAEEKCHNTAMRRNGCRRRYIGSWDLPSTRRLSRTSDDDGLMSLNEEDLMRGIPVEEAGAYFNMQQEYSLSVADLSRDIEMKERLFLQLKESVKRYEHLRRFYQEKIRQMDGETTRFEAERQKLLRDLEEAERRTEDEQKGMVSVLKRKLEEKNEQLQAAKKKQQELLALAKVKAKTDAQMRQLTEEIGAMKRQRVDLLSRMEVEKRRFQAVLKEKTVEIDMMKKAARRDAQEIHRLGNAVEKADVTVKKQHEEIASLKNRQQLLQTPRSSRYVGYDTNQVSANTERLKYSALERKTKRWLDARIREVAKKEEATMRLAAEYNRKMKILRTKEELEAARNRMFGPQRSVRDMIMPHEDQGGCARTTSLSPEEEATLEELEERIDACRAQLECKDEHIRQMEHMVGGLEVGEDAIEESCSTLEQSRTVIRVLFDMLVSSRRLAKQRLEKLGSLQQEKGQMGKALEESVERCAAEKRMYDQRLMRMTMDFEEKISGLIDHTQVSGLMGNSCLPNGDRPCSFHGPLHMEVLGVGSSSNKAGASLVTDDLDLSLTSSVGSGSSGVISTERFIPLDQYKCMAKLGNERNQVLREQVNQLQNIKEGLEQRVADMEERERRLREEFKEKDEELKWMNIELNETKARYIKLRGVVPVSARSPSRRGGAGERASDEEGVDDGDSDQEDEDYSDEDMGVNEEEDESYTNHTPWPKGIGTSTSRIVGTSNSLAMHRLQLNKIHDGASPTSSRLERDTSQAGETPRVPVYIRLAARENFTGIHKALTKEDLQEKRSRVESIRAATNELQRRELSKKEIHQRSRPVMSRPRAGSRDHQMGRMVTRGSGNRHDLPPPVESTTYNDVSCTGAARETVGSDLGDHQRSGSDLVIVSPGIITSEDNIADIDEQGSRSSSSLVRMEEEEDDNGDVGGVMEEDLVVQDVDQPPSSDFNGAQDQYEAVYYDAPMSLEGANVASEDRDSHQRRPSLTDLFRNTAEGWVGKFTRAVSIREKVGVKSRTHDGAPSPQTPGSS